MTQLHRVLANTSSPPALLCYFGDFFAKGCSDFQFFKPKQWVFFFKPLTVSSISRASQISQPRLGVPGAVPDLHGHRIERNGSSFFSLFFRVAGARGPWLAVSTWGIKARKQPAGCRNPFQGRLVIQCKRHPLTTVAGLFWSCPAPCLCCEGKPTGTPKSNLDGLNPKKDTQDLPLA